ncbi:MAG: ubiquinone biosynthesis protein UbiA, partial [Chitinophagia bacterium]|nr:ubiquinone biosynthesis protein UbiA [Chitinophagia bacterium]
MYWLRLIRWKNLLIVFATQLLVWYCLVYTSARIYYQRLTLDWVHFFPVCLSTLLITAAGYIINDYFDIKIDIINRPEKVVLEKKIPLRDAIIAHTLLNVGGLIAVFPIAYSNRHVHWLLLQLGCMVLLWFYSTHFKRQFIIGNVVVALLTALTIVVLVIYEQLMYKYIGMPVTIRYINNTYYINPIWICAGYATFAFMLTWMREVVKDMEDHEGDAEQGCQTMPIVKGLQFSAYFVVALGAITVILLGIIAGILFSTA